MLIVHLFLSYAHVNPCHSSSSSCCRGLAAASACGSTWTFLFTFLLTIVKVTFKTLKKYMFRLQKSSKIIRRISECFAMLVSRNYFAAIFSDVNMILTDKTVTFQYLFTNV